MIRPFGAGEDHFLLNLQRIQDRAAKAQRQITSGYRVERPSDAHDQVVNILQLQVKIAASTQSLTNLQSLQSEVDLNEAALRNSVRILQDITVAGAQGVDAHASAAERRLVGERIRDWHSQLVRVANLNNNGRYQFSGDQDQVAPYAVDWTQPGGVTRAHNSPDTRLVEDAGGNRYSVSRRAQDIFDVRDSTDAAAPGNIFHAVHALAVALEANDPVAADVALGQVKAGAEHLNNELSTFGRAQNQVDASIDQAQKIKLMATTELAALRETDLPSAVLELTQANTSLEAALGAQAKISRVTLFDYLG